jgi:predicted transcriptional regulator
MTREVDEDKRTTLRRFAALGAASPLAGLGGSDTSLSRDAITGYLAATPGAHFSKLRDDLQLGTGEVQHHVEHLLEAGTVESERDGDYRRFFVAGRFSEFERTALGALRRETPRAVLVQLLQEPGLSGATLADRLGVSRATISRTTDDLADRAVLASDQGYRIERPETVLVLVVSYADSFGEDAAAFAANAAQYVSFDP